MGSISSHSITSSLATLTTSQLIFVIILLFSTHRLSNGSPIDSTSSRGQAFDDQKEEAPMYAMPSDIEPTINLNGLVADSFRRGLDDSPNGGDDNGILSVPNYDDNGLGGPRFSRQTRQSAQLVSDGSFLRFGRSALRLFDPQMFEASHLHSRYRKRPVHDLQDQSFIRFGKRG